MSPDSKQRTQSVINSQPVMHPMKESTSVDGIAALSIIPVGGAPVEMYRICELQFQEVTKVLGLSEYLNKSLFAKVCAFGPDKYQFGFIQFLQ